MSEKKGSLTFWLDGKHKFIYIIQKVRVILQLSMAFFSSIVLVNLGCRCSEVTQVQ